MKRTGSFVKGVKAEDKPPKYSDGENMYLFVPTTGSKLWRLSGGQERAFLLHSHWMVEPTPEQQEELRAFWRGL